MDYLDLRLGECKEVMRQMIDEGVQVDSIVTDPPYHLHSIVRRFGKEGSAPAQYGRDGAFARASKGFMGQTWDGGDIANDPEMWNLALQLLKPGGHLLAFGGTRTYHRMACAVEDAGFEVRDQIQWLYGSGFPKNHDIGKQLDDWGGWGTALKPANEPILLARKPLSERNVASNVLKHGTGGLNVDGCRVSSDENTVRNSYAGTNGTGWGMGKRDNVNGSTRGRFPANVIHDGSDEVMEAFAAYGERTSGKPGVMRKVTHGMSGYGDTGSASRFFYSAKASKKDRGDFNTHPTCKPTDLMQYLIRMVTPPNGIVLDPFMGSGSTGKAAKLEKRGFIGIDMTEEYYNIAKRRIEEIEIPTELPFEDDE